MPRPPRAPLALALTALAVVALALAFPPLSLTSLAAASAVPTTGRALPAHAPHPRVRVELRVRQYEAARPWLLRIPAIRVTAAIVPTGVNRNGSVAVPSLANAQKAGWYKYGAVPGTAGPAILLGHVDTYVGPAVFYRLYLLRPGVRVYVRADGRVNVFVVTSIQQVSKQAFPPAVYAPGQAPVLYLVTCAGDFNYVTRHYDDNIIVTARFIQPSVTRSTHVLASKRRVTPVTTGGGETRRPASPRRGHPPGRGRAAHRAGFRKGPPR